MTTALVNGTSTATRARATQAEAIVAEADRRVASIASIGAAGARSLADTALVDAAHRLRRGAPLPEVAELLRDAAQAVDELHAALVALWPLIDPEALQ